MILTLVSRVIGSAYRLAERNMIWMKFIKNRSKGSGDNGADTKFKG